MATAPTLPLLPPEEYLESSYHPDREYVDGVLLERSVPSIPHSILQMLVIQFLAQFQESLKFLALPEVRTQIIAKARYRIPDVLLCSLPLPKGRVVDTVPGTVIEILSPEDRMGEALERFKDYASIGVEEIVQLDPERYVAHSYRHGSLIQTDFNDLPIQGSSKRVPFPSIELFDRLRELLTTD